MTDKIRTGDSVPSSCAIWLVIIKLSTVFHLRGKSGQEKSSTGPGSSWQLSCASPEQQKKCREGACGVQTAAPCFLRLGLGSNQSNRMELREPGEGGAQARSWEGGSMFLKIYTQQIIRGIILELTLPQNSLVVCGLSSTRHLACIQRKIPDIFPFHISKPTDIVSI